MWLERMSGGGADLIGLADAKAHLRLLGNDFDTEVQQAISAASLHLDVDEDGFGGIGAPLVSQEWAVKGTGFSPKLLRLPFGRVRSVNEVRYFDQMGVSQTVPANDFALVRDGRDYIVQSAFGKSWPSVQLRPDAVTIRFTAGWATAAEVPEDLKHCARLLVGHFFRNKEATAGRDVPQQIQMGVDALTRRYRRFAM